MRYQAQIHGLRYGSDLDLPQLGLKACAEQDALPASDVEIGHGEVPGALPGSQFNGFLEWTGEASLLNLGEGGRMLVAGGSEITIQEGSSSRLGLLHAHLAVTGLSMIAMQRHDLLLHGSCLAKGDKGLAFVGSSGSGKSTALAAMSELGYRSVSDDSFVPQTRKDGVFVWPGLRQVKLDGYVAKNFEGLSAHEYEAPNSPKLLHSMADSDAEQAARLVRIFVLRWLHPSEKGIRFEKLGPFDALSQLRENVFRPEIAGMMGQGFANMAAIGKVLESVEVYAAYRPRNVAMAGEFARAVDRLMDGE